LDSYRRIRDKHKNCVIWTRRGRFIPLSLSLSQRLASIDRGGGRRARLFLSIIDHLDRRPAVLRARARARGRTWPCRKSGKRKKEKGGGREKRRKEKGGGRDKGRVRDARANKVSGIHGVSLAGADSGGGHVV